MLTDATAAPHGPDMSGHHNPVHEITENERQIFQYLIRPDDSYDEHGVYWADMPIGKRIKFVTNYDNAEAKRELSAIGRMTKADPLSPISYYFRNMVLPGAGLGLEGLVGENYISALSTILTFPDMFCFPLETSSRCSPPKEVRQSL